MIFWIVLSILALKYGHYALSSAFLALACSTKHFAWVLVPFYFIYLGGPGSINVKFSRIRKPLFVFIFITGMIILPWILINPSAFYQDVLAYISGTLPDSYPISGHGFSALLLKLGILKSETDYLPFTVLQIATTLPVFLFLVSKQFIYNTTKRMLLNFAISLTLILYFSVSFNDNYIGFLFVVFSLAILIDPRITENRIQDPNSLKYLETRMPNP